jgi:hypothetical protein
MAKIKGEFMTEPTSTAFKISRVLPPHELNARRARKHLLKAVVFARPLAEANFQKPKLSPNDHVFNHGVDTITHHE